MDARFRCLDDQILLDHVFGELSADEHAWVDEHLKSCAQCTSRREELVKETDALKRAVDRDTFPSAGRVRRARQALHESFERYEDERAVSREPAFADELAPRFGWSRRLAVAAIFLVCLGGGAWFWLTPEVLDASQVLTRARSAESAIAGQPLFQRFRVELIQVEPQRDQRLGHLETWSDPADQRFASRWVDPAGSVQFSLWNRVEDHQVLTSIYNPSAAEIVTAVGEQGERQTLLGIARDGTTTDALAAGFIRWIEARSWQPVSLAAGIIQLIDESGMQVELSQPAGRPGVLRLSARRQTGARTATVTLDVNEETHKPIQLRIRFETAEGVAELAMIREETRVLTAGGLDPAVFEPRLPDSARTASSRAERKTSSSRGPREGKPQPPTPQEKLDAGLRIRYAIHQTGLCLGKPVNVTEQESGIAVAGLVSSMEQKASILEQLVALGLPRWVSVKIRTLAEEASQAENGPASALVEPLSVDSGSGAPPARARIADFKLPIQEELEKYFDTHPVPVVDASSQASATESGTSGKIMAFANEAVTTSETALAHAMELRRLTEDYDRVAADELGGETKTMLREMLLDHLEKLRVNAVRTRGLMLPVLKEVASGRGLPAVSPAAEKTRPPSWGEACMDLFGAANRIHSNTVNLLAVNLKASNPQTETFSEVDRALVELTDALRSIESDIAFASRQVAASRQTFP